MRNTSLEPLAWALVAGLVMTGCSGGGGGSSAPVPSALDSDGDGVANTVDAFPNDPAASKDTDGDGFPDAWNANATAGQIAASTLKLDAFATDAAASLDTDKDGSPDAWNANATPAQIAASTLKLDAFAADPAASLDTDKDGFPDAWNANATPTQIANSTLQVDGFPLQPIAGLDADGDGMPDAFVDTATPQEIADSGLILDLVPGTGIVDIPTGILDTPAIGAASPLDFGNGRAGDFEQQMLRFEEFGPEPYPTAEATNWEHLPLPIDPQHGPDPLAFDAFLRQDGVSPLPTRLSNVTVESPWKPVVAAFINRPWLTPTGYTGVANPAEGRPWGEDWAHQRWDDFPPKTFYKTGLAGSRVNQGLRDSKQRHGYALGEFAPGGLYHNVAGVPATEGTSAGIGIAFHPKLPIQGTNALWTFDGTLPPKLLHVRYGEPILWRNYNALPMDVTANGGFGRHTISTHEHNGHQPGESDGFAYAFFYPGQFYDYRWPLQLAGFSNNNNASGAINYAATDPKAATPCVAGESFTVLVNGIPTERFCQNLDVNGNGTVMLPGDWRETMSTHWFHDHMLDHTSENVYKGNAAIMNYYSAVDRGNEAINDGVNLRFPSGTALSWGNRDYDVNLVVADKAWDPVNGQLWMNTVQRNGYLGDRMTVNFLYKPYFNVRARRYRFRILEGSVSRIMAFGLVQEVNIPFGSPGAGELAGPAGSNVSYNRVPFHMIANDGNIMKHAIPFDGNHDYLNDGKPEDWKGQLPSQTIAERYDIIVDFSKHGILPGDKLYFVNIMEHADGKGTKAKIPMADILSGRYQAFETPNGKWANGDPCVGKFMELRVQAYAGTDLSMDPVAYEPGGLTMIPNAIDPSDPAVRAALNAATHHTFDFVRGGNVQGGHGTPWAIKVDGGAADKADPRRISAFENGDLQVWTIKTGGGWTHPVHIHFEEGVILTRGGKTPPAWEIGARKDMYRIGPENDSDLHVEVAYRARDFFGHYVEHCHNTMHEDHAMLLRWDARAFDANSHAVVMDTPVPNWDAVFWEPSYSLIDAENGDGTGPVIPIP